MSYGCSGGLFSSQYKLSDIAGNYADAVAHEIDVGIARSDDDP